MFLLLLCFLLFFFFFFFDAHKLPRSYRRHVARWFGARNVLFFVVAARLFLVFASFLLLCCWSAHKSIAPRTRTLLGVLGQATLHFVAVATLLFFFFCVCPKFFDLAKQRRKIFVGVSEVGKIDFALYFFWLCVLFLVFHFLLLRSRDAVLQAVAALPLPDHLKGDSFGRVRVTFNKPDGGVSPHSDHEAYDDPSSLHPLFQLPLMQFENGGSTFELCWSLPEIHKQSSDMASKHVSMTMLQQASNREETA